MFRIPTSGGKPIIFSAEILPEGLHLDASAGILSGSIQTAGEYRIQLKAANEKGQDSKFLKIAIGLSNLSENARELFIDFSRMDLNGPVLVRDLWRQIDVGKFTGIYKAEIPRHGVELVKDTNSF